MPPAIFSDMGRSRAGVESPEFRNSRQEAPLANWSMAFYRQSLINAVFMEGMVARLSLLNHFIFDETIETYNTVATIRRMWCYLITTLNSRDQKTG
ncbi:hypothetical protein AMTR_s00007p00259930 [Amborella trichopoda]|uniref:Uncharacterized protein n=1 Tax=Amborella trichopoda TaxID=13333 RepID=W1PEM4_AMBTC|nr:hypothetical protein AMTR_s00007p00259930 [Amborella trichopoda]